MQRRVRAGGGSFGPWVWNSIDTMQGRYERPIIQEYGLSRFTFQVAELHATVDVLAPHLVRAKEDDQSSMAENSVYERAALVHRDGARIDEVVYRFCPPCQIVDIACWLNRWCGVRRMKVDHQDLRFCETWEVCGLGDGGIYMAREWVGATECACDNVIACLF